MNNELKCHGCRYFYVTYKQSKPYGCKAYGFISRLGVAEKPIHDISLFFFII